MGDVVYLRVDQSETGMVTGIVQRPAGYTYLVSWHDRTESEHSCIELTSEKTYN
jgi:hypothetical protein